MIDLKAARAEPDAWRAALARKGAGEAFDELLAADERWRALVPRVDELRSRTKLKGKPTPEQLEELQQVKEELRTAEEELAAAEAAREAALALVPNPPHESAPDGDTEDDAVELRRFGEPPALAEAKEASEIGRFELERAARLSGSRFGFIVGDTALLALALYRFALDHVSAAGFTAGAPTRARARGGDDRHRLLPHREVEHLRARGGRPLPHRHLGGRARGDAHDGDPRGRRAAAPVRRLLDLLPARGGSGRQGHARDVPRPPVQQGRDVRLHDARRTPGPSTTGWSRSRRICSSSSGSPTAPSTSPPATSAPRPRRRSTSRRGSRHRSATAR